MPTMVSVPLPTLVGWNNIRRYTGGTPDAGPPFALNVLTDGDPNSGVILGMDGAGNLHSSGVMETENGALSLSSGQAIDRVTAAVAAAPGDGTALTIEAVLGASRALMWTSASPGVTATLGAPPGYPLGTDWRAHVASLHTWFESWNPAPTGWPSAVSNFQYAAIVYNRPSAGTLAIETVAGLGVRSIQWAFSGDGLGQHAYRIKIFTAAQYGAGGFNPDTTPATIDTGVMVSTNQFYQFNGLVPGTTYRAYVQVAQRLPVSGFLHWSTDGTSLNALGAAAYFQFAYTPDPPIAPINIGPSGTIETTDRPTLTANFAGLIEAVPVRVEWQLATNAGFTTNVRTVAEPANSFAPSSPRAVQVTAAAELTQGTWYLRARSYNTVGQVSSWTSAVSFTVSHPPAAVPVTPKSNGSIDSRGTTFAWTFTDPSPYDSQTAFQVQVENVGTGVVLYDSGKMASTEPRWSQDIAIYHTNLLLRWKVRVWDSDDVVGAYSTAEQFYARYPADIEMPLGLMYPPHSAAVITEPAPELSWSFTPNYTGQVQGSFRLQVHEIIEWPSDYLTVYDSGWVTSSETSHKLTAPVLENDKEYIAQVWARDQDGINALKIVGGSIIGDNAVETFRTEWVAPPVPEPTVDATTFDTAGGVTLSWAQNRDPAFHSYRVYKRDVGGEWELAATTTDNTPETYALVDFYGRSGVAQQYAVSQVADRFGSLIESAKSPASDVVVPLGSHYWLLVPDNPTLNIRLSNIENDSLKVDYEEEAIQLLGRGRRIERGTYWGITGSISGHVYDTELRTARETRLALEAIKAGALDIWLRNPFGDIWRVSLQDLEIDRLAGYGTNEYFGVSFNYVEVS